MKNRIEELENQLKECRFALQKKEQEVVRHKNISETNNHVVLQDGVVACITLNSEFQIISFNRIAGRLFRHFNQQKLIERKYFLEYLDNKPEMQQCLEQALTGKINRIESFFGQNGEYCFEIQTIPLYEAGERISAIYLTIRNISEIKKEKSTNTIQSKWLDCLLREMPHLIYIQNTRGNILFANQATAAFFGYQHHYELIGKNVNELHTREIEAKQKYANKQQTDNGKKIYYSEEELINANNQLHVFSTIKIPFKDNSINTEGIITVAIDISDMKKKQQEILDSIKQHEVQSNMLHLIADNCPDMLWAKDLDNKYLFANQALCNKLLIAQDTKEPIGKSDMFFARREQSRMRHDNNWHTFGEICINSDNVVLRNKKAQRFDEYGFVQGKFLYLDVNKAPLRNEAGQIIGTVGCGRIVTKEREIENNLRESEKLFRDIFLLQNAIRLLIDPKNGKLIDANKSAAAFYGYPINELKQKTVFDIYSTSKNKLKEKIYNALTIKQNYFQFAHRIPNGEIRYVEEYTAPVQYKKQKLLFTVIHDITERKKMYDALQESQKELREANTTKDKFFSIIAHDLKNPLNNLIGLSELLIDKAAVFERSKIKRFAQLIFESSQETYNLLENLLEWSRSQTGTIGFAPIQLDLNDLIFSNISLLRQNAENKNIKIAFQSKRPVYAEVDRQMLNTVIRNLLSNAIKFTHNNGTIQIEIFEKDQWVSFCIKDDGIGMDEESMQKLFKPDENFTRLGTQEEKGTGLGLILCKEFINKHKGTISVESLIGEGSVFTVKIPVKQEAN